MIPSEEIQEGDLVFVHSWGNFYAEVLQVVVGHPYKDQTPRYVIRHPLEEEPRPFHANYVVKVYSLKMFDL